MELDKVGFKLGLHHHRTLGNSAWSSSAFSAATWIDLEGIMLSEISQTEEANIVWYQLYVESKKYNKLVNITKKKQTHRYREQTSGYHWEAGGAIEEWRQRRYKLLGVR